MNIVEAAQLTNEEIGQLLRKPRFDEVELGERGRAGVKKVFGQELSAAAVVDKIVADVRQAGDEAVIKYTRLLDGAELTSGSLAVAEAEYEAAYRAVKEKTLAAIRQSITNVRAFHAEQLPKSWLTYRDHGAMLGQNCTALERVGIYVPGGTAAYPSSVIMNAVPAKVAGVKEIVMVVPPNRDGSVNPHVLVAAREAGVDRVFKVGGAQAIAALAFGTAAIPRVDKITGPGNIFVTLAKKAVYGYCDIDMLAGPSEILIIADAGADPAFVAADLLSQAEHDVLASSILVTDSPDLARKAAAEVEVQLNKLPRREIAAESLAGKGLIIITENLPAAVELANLSAPEHLEILTAEPFKILPLVRNAGAIFLGAYSPEPLGDYFAGPNHVLPTGGTARFYSVLNVETFMKKSSIIAYSQEALLAVDDQIITLAQAEGLDAHARAVKVRRDRLA